MNTGSVLNDVPLSNQFRGHFGHRRHLYGVLLDALANDLDAGGPTAEICVEHMRASRGDAIQLRLLAGIFRIVLRGEAPELAPYYATRAEAADSNRAWALLRPVLARHVEELQGALELAPQTNEVGRSACLAVGLFEAVRRHELCKLRLLEPGASAGLNLNVDRYRMIGPGWGWGPVDSPLILDTGAQRVLPEDITVLERRGCDLSPVDVSTQDGASYLTSFVWPFHPERHDRLAAAIEVARRYPVKIDRAPASTWITEQLARPVANDVLTVVWQSITEQYWPDSERGAVAAALDDARHRMPLAHVSMEGVPPSQGSDGYSIAELGPKTRVDGTLIARSHHHGLPLVLASSGNAGDLDRRD